MVNKTLLALILTRLIASVEFIDESGGDPRVRIEAAGAPSETKKAQVDNNLPGPNSSTRTAAALECGCARVSGNGNQNS